MSESIKLAGLIIATGLERDPERAQMAHDHLDHLIALAVMLDADPVVVVHDAPVRVAAPARALLMPRAARDEFSSLRMGLTQFANAPVSGAIILPLEAHGAPIELLRSLVTEQRRTGAPLVATAHNGALGLPLFATRDSWRELMTTIGGLDAVLKDYGPRVSAVESP
ncbi:MAG: hypothetical protein ABIZ91_01050 [Gemmatimonadaceae bacterium]